jgi:hypothetical protein
MFKGFKMKKTDTSKATKLLGIANEPHISFKGKYIHFGDIHRGEHVVPFDTIRLRTEFIKESKNLDEEPDTYAYFVRYEGREVEVTGCLWFELQDMLMKR